MWFLADVLKLFSLNAVPFSQNVGQSAPMSSANPVPESRCFWSPRFMFSGRYIYLNPLYGRQIGDWMAKAASEAAAGRASPVIALVPARTDTEWWHTSVVAAGATVALLKGRLKFGGEGGQGAPFPSALVLWSGTAEHTQRLRAAAVRRKCCDMSDLQGQ